MGIEDVCVYDPRISSAAATTNNAYASTIEKLSAFGSRLITLENDTPTTWNNTKAVQYTQV